MKNIDEYKASFFVSVGLHLVVLAFFVVSFSSSPLGMQKKGNIDVIKAVAVSKKDIESEIAKIKHEKAESKRQEQKRIAAYKQKLAKAKQQQELEQQKLEKLAKEHETHKKTIAVAKRKAELQEEAAKKKQQELAELQKKLAQQKEAEKKHEAEVKKRKLAELKEKEAAELEKARNEELEAEHNALTKAAEERISKEVEKYKAIIVSTISRSWLVPPQANKKATCELLIKIGPGGVVLDVKTVKSSGDATLDRSVRTAVMKASPLPVPEKPEVFDRFRELKLTVRPEKIISR